MQFHCILILLRSRRFHLNFTNKVLVPFVVARVFGSVCCVLCSFWFHFDFTSRSFHFEFSLISCRFHFEFISVSLRLHCRSTLISLRSHFDFTWSSLGVLLAFISLSFHIGFMTCMNGFTLISLRSTSRPLPLNFDLTAYSL